MKATARLRNYPTSPFKMRLLVNTVRGKKVEDAITILEHSPRPAATPLRKLLLSALSNWRQKNPDTSVEGVIISAIYVDGARSLKRMLPAPQGRAYRIQKRSHHIFVELDKSLSIPASKPIAKLPAREVVDNKGAEESTQSSIN